MTPTQITYENGNQVTLEIPDVERGYIKNVKIDGRAVSPNINVLLIVCLLSIISLIASLAACGMLYAMIDAMIDVRPCTYEVYEKANKLPTKP